MVGLELPFVVKCRESDRANLRTIIHLLKKTRDLRLDTIRRSFVVLRVIGQYPSKFKNIRGLHI